MSGFGISLECEYLLPVEKRPCHKMVNGWLCVPFRRATIRCERAFGFRLFWHDQFIPKKAACEGGFFLCVDAEIFSPLLRVRRLDARDQRFRAETQGARLFDLMCLGTFVISFFISGKL